MYLIKVDWYGSRQYNGSLERRKITLKLDDVSTGQARVVSDSWLESDYYRKDAPCGGQAVYLSAFDPSTGAPDAMLVKNARVDIMGEDMNDLNSGRGKELALWWVGLEQYLAMP